VTIEVKATLFINSFHFTPSQVPQNTSQCIPGPVPYSHLRYLVHAFAAKSYLILVSCFPGKSTSPLAGIVTSSAPLRRAE
jgi:hypothetical protein